MSRPFLRARLVAALLLAGCGPTSSTVPAGAPAAPRAALATAPAAKPTPASRPRWQNPGGMWMPQQLAAQAETLRALGLQLDPATLGDPASPTLGAIVSLGAGCSAAFVSADGLIVTNHHCVQSDLQYSSTPEQNLIETGFLARTRAEEKWAGPTERVYVTQKYTDVTAAMTEGLADIKDDLARRKTLAQREKGLLAACERDRPAIRCRVADFFAGAQWFLIEQLEIKDVRLVYAPARGIGNFGGEVDNWRWPRHAGDFAFLRAYVGKDGKPGNHADDNIEFKPEHFLHIAKEPLHEGDFVMVAGYPGSTQRLATSTQLAAAAEWQYPRSIALYEQYLGVIESVTAGKPELVIKAEPGKRRLNNFKTKYHGQLETMDKGGLVDKRSAEDAELRAWIEKDAERAARYRPGLDQLAAVEAAHQRTREADATLAELVLGSSTRRKERRTPETLLAASFAIARLAAERGKPDGERAGDFQERNWQRLEQEQLAFQTSYARELDRAVLAMFIRRALALPREQQPALLDKLLGKKRDPRSIDAALDKLYAATRLEDTSKRVELIQHATLASLRKSKDPFVQLALAALPEMAALEDRWASYEGALARLAPLYVAALRELRGGAIAPDANSTLRITYGTVQPPPRGGRAFTTLAELLAKVTGEAPFAAPAGLLDAAREKKLGSYAAAELGDVPVDFMSDLDITNGNSGSSTLNARGEVVGVVFDGTYESVASDWLYLAGITRSIHCDIRYALWVMDAVDGADALLTELGVEPSL